MVICSDGLDRGDPDILATAMERLSRQCHRIVWMNPHTGPASSVGLMVAEPHIDLRRDGAGSREPRRARRRSCLPYLGR